MSNVSNRLVRLLNMVPYFQANPHVSHEKAATDLHVTPKQLLADLNQLWMCGLPGGAGGTMIDLDFEGDTIEVIFSAGMDTALRLTSPEATGVLMALRALVDVPGVVDPDVARSVIAKIEAAAGAAGATAASMPAPDSAGDVENKVTAIVRAAVRNKRMLSLEYYSASHDTVSHRVVDPIRVALIGDHSYLEAWCRTAEGVRLFRFDRIVDAAAQDEPAAPPAPAVQAGTDTSLFSAETADPGLPVATLLIDESASWMFDYYPLREQHAIPDGGWEATMTYASDDWMARFVLGFGSAVRVLDPPELVDRVRESAIAALAAYEPGRGE